MHIVHLFNPSNFELAVKEAQDFTNETGVEAKVVTVAKFNEVELANTYVETSEVDLKPIVMTHYNSSAMKSYGVTIPKFSNI